MPAFSFKERFVPMVKDGSKPGTIRAFRKYPIKVGQLAHLFYGMRTKYCTKLIDPSPVIRETRCVLLTAKGILYLFETNWIAPALREEILNGRGFSEVGNWKGTKNINEKDRFAWEDGFRHSDAPLQQDGCFEIMLRYWKQNNGLPFIGTHTLWGESKISVNKHYTE